MRSFGILFTGLYLIISSMGIGLIRSKSEINWYTVLLKGFVISQGLVWIPCYFLVIFRLHTFFLWMIYFVLFALSILSLIANWSKLIINRKSLIEMTCGVIFVAGMGYIFSQRALAYQTFDTVHYLSLVIENASRTVLGGVKYFTGEVAKVSILRDFHPYYYQFSFLIWVHHLFAEFIYSKPSPYFIELFIWGGSLFFYLVSFCFACEVRKILSKYSKNVSVLITIFLLFFIGNFYYNNAFSFYGNTYRQLLSAYLSLQIYILMKDKIYNFSSFVLIAFIYLALMAVSSAGIFISIISFIALVFILIQIEIDRIAIKVLILFIPLIFYPLLLLEIDIGRLLFLIAAILFIWLCLSYDFLQQRKKHLNLKKILNIIKWLVPIAITVISVCLLINGTLPKVLFFEAHSKVDMVWNYFTFNDLVHFSVNFIYWIAIAVCFNKKLGNKNPFFNYSLMIVVMFINPINYLFLYKFLTGFVYYRSFETVLNSFTLILLVIGLTKIFNEKFQKCITTTLIIIFSLFSLYYVNNYYHFFFKPESDFDMLSKLSYQKLEVLRELQDQIMIEKVTQAKIISQIEVTKGFITDAVMVVGNDEFRDIDKYRLNESDNLLLKLFIPRDYVGQKIFYDEPDYGCLCDELVTQWIDFAIVDKQQRYIDSNGKELPLYYLIRDCGNLVYENNRYELYFLFWERER